jgi:hypothetical protein
MATEKKPAKQELTLEALQEQLRGLMEELNAAKAEVASMKESKEKAKLTEEEKAARLAYANELVEVKLFKDNGKYKDDVFVGVNGENVVIQRGERVKIPRKFAEVLDNSDRQDYETAKLIEQRSGEFAKSGL